MHIFPMDEVITRISLIETHHFPQSPHQLRQPRSLCHHLYIFIIFHSWNSTNHGHGSTRITNLIVIYVGRRCLRISATCYALSLCAGYALASSLICRSLLQARQLSRRPIIPTVALMVIREGTDHYFSVFYVT